jgi:predicted nucleotide-binding protein (sugar kinase/HSP70/actin superfamily)
MIFRSGRNEIKKVGKEFLDHLQFPVRVNHQHVIQLTAFYCFAMRFPRLSKSSDGMWDYTNRFFAILLCGFAHFIERYFEAVDVTSSRVQIIWLYFFCEKKTLFLLLKRHIIDTK